MRAEGWWLCEGCQYRSGSNIVPMMSMIETCAGCGRQGHLWYYRNGNRGDDLLDASWWIVAAKEHDGGALRSLVLVEGRNKGEAYGRSKCVLEELCNDDTDEEIYGPYLDSVLPEAMPRGKRLTADDASEVLAGAER